MRRFGETLPDLSYRIRPTAFGIVERGGLIATVRVARPNGDYHDLPGGALDGDETEAEALAREFVEETGLTIRPLDRFAEAAQRFVRSDGSAVDNQGGFWTASLVAVDPSAKCEDDHTLVWLDPDHAAAAMRHPAHAWAIEQWRNGTPG